jgi:hypothetical protein
MIERDQLKPQAAAQSANLPPEPSSAAHWEALSNSEDEAAYCFAWLAMMCARIPGATTGLLCLRPPNDTTSPTITWPEANLDLADLAALADRAFAEKRTSVTLGRNGRGTNQSQSIGLLVAVPLAVGDEPIGVAGVALNALRGSSSVAPEAIVEQIRWGTGWLKALLWAQRVRQAAAYTSRASSALDLLAVAGEHRRIKSSATAVVNELATRLRCDRVSVGFTDRNGSIRLRVVSQSTNFHRQSRLVEAIENTMQEAVDQSAAITLPTLPSTERAVTLAHRSLSKMVGAVGSIMTVVLPSARGGSIGAITFERHVDHPFDEETLRFAEAIAVLLGPFFALHLDADRIVAGRLVDLTRDGLFKVFGPGRPALKSGVLCVGALLLYVSLAEGVHRVTAKAVLEGEVQRAAVAPFDGFIRLAPVRAGDIVRKGDLLAALDDRDLILDSMKWRAERDKLSQKERDALAKHDRSNLIMLKAQIDQAEAQLALADEKLSRSKIVAPFDGVVVSGDLSQMLGSPIERGKVLFETAPLEAYRLIVHVDERDVRFVATGQTGDVALAGQPAERVPFTITKITPVTVADDGRNTFRIEARIGESDISLRPGMEGVAKIETGSRSLVWIWTHDIVDWLRVTVWKYLP